MANKCWRKSKGSTKYENIWKNKSSGEQVVVSNPYKDNSVHVWFAMDKEFKTLDGNKKFHKRKEAFNLAQDYMKKHDTCQ